MDPTVPVTNIRTMEEILARNRWPQRTFGVMFLVFSIIAIVLAAVGLYSVTAYSVAQRTQEIGIRMALGAEARQVRWLIVRRSLIELGVGLCLGIAAALETGRLLQGMLVGTGPADPLMLISIDRTSRTLPALQKRRAFVINFLREGAEDLATLFASKSDDKFRGVRWQPSPEADGSPILREVSVAYAACRVTESREAGDHWIFIASVEAGEVLGGTPLMYYRRTYAAWSAERPAPPVEGVS